RGRPQGHGLPALIPAPQRAGHDGRPRRRAVPHGRFVAALLGLDDRTEAAEEAGRRSRGGDDRLPAGVLPLTARSGRGAVGRPDTRLLVQWSRTAALSVSGDG